MRPAPLVSESTSHQWVDRLWSQELPFTTGFLLQMNSKTLLQSQNQHLKIQSRSMFP